MIGWSREVAPLGLRDPDPQMLLVDGDLLGGLKLLLDAFDVVPRFQAGS